MSVVDDLQRLASRMERAYSLFSKEYEKKIPPVEEAITKIKVKFQHGKPLPSAEAGVTLGVSRIGSAWRLTVHASCCHPLCISEAPLEVKIAAVEIIDDFVKDYIEHVKIERARIIEEADRAAKIPPKLAALGEECPMCDGDGVVDEDECQNCDGTGVVKFEDDE